MKDPTLERSHSSAKHVTCGLVIKQLWEYMKDPTLERGHTSAKLVTSGFLRREHYKGMKNCTLDSSHILQITMKHLLAGFARRNWAVLPSFLATMRNTWSCLDFIVDHFIWFVFGWLEHTFLSSFCSILITAVLPHNQVRRKLWLPSVTILIREHFL